MPTVRYAGGHLDRAANLRHDEDWVSAAYVSDASLAVLMHEDRCLVAGVSTGEPKPALVPLAVVRPRISAQGLTWVFLGLDGEVPVFATDLSDDTIPGAPELSDTSEFVDLRRVGAFVSATDASMLAYARAMLAWHRRHRFCSVCGTKADSARAGHVRRCGNPECRAEAFPRTDPVVIMLVTRPATTERPARVLLGRHGRLPRGAYSLLAGFVEAGESLEEAVTREVWEEAGVRVRDIIYEASQPWPFPHSMMIGFRATAESDEIALDKNELEDAQWFTAAEVAAFGDWDDNSATFRRPRRDSIARLLLDQWVDGQ